MPAVLAPEAPALPEGPVFSLEEHRRLEEETGRRFHWLEGEVYAMPGARPGHIDLAHLLQGWLFERLRSRGGGCQFRGGDTRVTDPERTFVAYPDGLIACPPVYAPDVVEGTVTNPLVIFEILSPSTERFDRRLKFARYRRIPTFPEYVLLHPDAPRVEVLRAPGWETSVAEGLDGVLTLESVGVEIPLGDLYGS